MRILGRGRPPADGISYTWEAAPWEAQLSHAGGKGSTAPPWLGGKKVTSAEGGWEPVAPSGEPFDKDYPVPRALTAAEIGEIVGAFRKAAERALAAGLEVLKFIPLMATCCTSLFLR